MSARAVCAGLVGAGLGLALVACGGDSGVGLADPVAPETSTTSSAPPSPSATPPVEQEVLATYEAFYEALGRARANPREAEEILAPVATGLQLETSVSGIKGSALAGQEIFGAPVIDPQVVSVENGTAVVHDCQDTSSVGSRDIATGEILTLGRAGDSAESTLQLVDGTWKVATTEFVEPADAYCAAR